MDIDQNLKTDTLVGQEPISNHLDQQNVILKLDKESGDQISEKTEISSEDKTSVPAAITTKNSQTVMEIAQENHAPPSPPPSRLTSPILAKKDIELSQTAEPDEKTEKTSQDDEAQSASSAPAVDKRVEEVSKEDLPPTPELTPKLAPKPSPILHKITEERDLRLFRILKIDTKSYCRNLHCPEEIALQLFVENAIENCSEHRTVLSYLVEPEVRVSCINWKGRCFITGTDIVRLLLHRYETFVGRKPASIKKFEEGIFSDLRRLTPPKDCVLEGTRSEFLLYLFDYDCVRSKKKQKVFFWKSFVRCYQNLFCDAMDRELARIEMAKAVGMSIEDFIKSGVVPTGSSSQDTNRRPLPFDWTLKAQNRIPTDDTEGYKLEPILGVDQIHYIRNDVSTVFSRHLRVHLGDRLDVVSKSVIEDAEKIWNELSVPGKKVDASKRQTTAIAEKSSRKSSRATNSAKYNEDDFDEPEYIPVRTARRRAAAVAEKAVSESVSPFIQRGNQRASRKSSSPKQRQRGVPIKLKMRKPLSPLPYDDDGYGSDATISSNDEEIQSIYRAYKQSRQIMPNSPIFSFYQSPPLMMKRPFENYDTFSLDKIQNFGSKKIKYGEESNLFMNSSQTSNSDSMCEYEAAYILLGINRGLM